MKLMSLLSVLVRAVSVRGGVLAIVVGLTPLASAQVLISGTSLSNSVTGSATNGNTTLPYRLYQPTGVAEGQKVPLVLFLHGSQERGTDNALQTYNMGGLVDHTRSGKYASFVLAPQINTAQWFASTSSVPTEAMALTLKALHDVINDTPNVDTSRIYITGLSMGGMGTWDAMRREPGTFAAAVPMSGGYDPAAAATIKDIPVWAFHGDSDTMVPVQASRDMIQALRDAGGDPRYSEVAGGGHVIWDPIYRDDDLYAWMFSKHLGGDAAPDSSAFSFAAPIPAPEPTSVGFLMLAGLGWLTKRGRRA